MPSGNRNRHEGIDPYAADIIKYKARQLVGSMGFTEVDRQDLEQELILDLLRRLPKYDATRAQRTTFIARLVDHKVATIIEARRAGKRDRRLCTCSLNDSVETEDGDSVERVETISQEDYLRRTGRLSSPTAELCDLAMDLGRVTDRLPPDLRDLCRRLRTHTIAEISRDTGIPRGTIYELRRKVRAAFEEAGLKVYL